MPSERSDPITAALTEPQREAVTYGDGPLLVVAGAGSGKTRVITHRIAHLVREGVPPDRILAVTFTNKAAGEMRRRVGQMVGREVPVSTFHSFCARLLRREASHLGMDPSFTIYDRADSLRVVRQICRDMNLDTESHPPSKALDIISSHKDRLEGPQESQRDALGIAETTVAEVYARYERRLAECNALDFDDLLVRPIELFRTCPGVLQQYQRTYLHVLVDEYQDTNLPQHLLARALQGRHRNITAVGDPDQMIYTWRGARLENILEFQKDFPGAHVVTLEKNYRSSGNILHSASACISFNRLRHEKALWTDGEAGEPVRVIEFGDSYDEAEWVAETAREAAAEGCRPREMAILYRTKYQPLPFEEAFASRGIPYQVVDTTGFFDRKPVKDLRAYMQLLVNPRDDEAFLRVVNVPARGIGKKTVERLIALAAGLREPLMRAARDDACLEKLGPRAPKALKGFCDLYDRLAALKRESVFSFLKQVIRQTDYTAAAPADQREEVREILDYLLGHAKQYDRRFPEGDLQGFLEQTALISDVDGWKTDADALPMMTLHSAKGLEFDVVFITGLEEEILPHRRALEESGGAGEDYALEEERRLLYVGMTRARQRLYLTHTQTRMIRGRERAVSPSRFLDELPARGVERERTASATQPGGPALRFDREVEAVLKQKRSPLRLADEAETGSFSAGMAVTHETYGEGVVANVESAGRYCLVRVEFARHGVLTILLDKS